MTDSMTNERMIVNNDGTGGPYIMVPVEQLETVEALLRDNNVSYWVDTDAISLDGRPAVTVVNLGRGANEIRIQKILDTAI
jgi:hypothetical protein